MIGGIWIPDVVLDSVANLSLNPFDFFVYTLVECGHQDQYAGAPINGDFAKYAQMSLRSVHRSLKALKKKGLVTLKRDGDGDLVAETIWRNRDRLGRVHCQKVAAERRAKKTGGRNGS